MIQASNRYEGLDGEVPVPAERRCMAASGGAISRLSTVPARRSTTASIIGASKGSGAKGYGAACSTRPAARTASSGWPRRQGVGVVRGALADSTHIKAHRCARRNYGPHKTLCNRFAHRNWLGVSSRILAPLAEDADRPDHVMIGGGRCRGALNAKGVTPRIPPVKNGTAPLIHAKALDKIRRKVENMVAMLKDWRPIATRYGRRTRVHSFPQYASPQPSSSLSSNESRA